MQNVPSAYGLIMPQSYLHFGCNKKISLPTIKSFHFKRNYCPKVNILRSTKAWKLFILPAMKNAEKCWFFWANTSKISVGIETYTTTDSKTKSYCTSSWFKRSCSRSLSHRGECSTNYRIGSLRKRNFYGIQTLRKSIPTEKSTTVEFPAATVNDAPRFPYRGMHLDVCAPLFCRRSENIHRYSGTS